MNKQIVVHPHHGILLSNEKDPTYATGWINHKHPMLSERHQSKKKKTFCMIPLHDIPEKAKL